MADIKTTKRQTRGALKKGESTFIAAWIPDDIVAAIDAEVRRTDLDRSKVIRKALRAFLPHTF